MRFSSLSGRRSTSCLPDGLAGYWASRQCSSNARAGRCLDKLVFCVPNCCQPSLLLGLLHFPSRFLTSLSISCVPSGACPGVLVFVLLPAMLCVVEGETAACSIGHRVRTAREWLLACMCMLDPCSGSDVMSRTSLQLLAQVLIALADVGFLC